VALDVEVEATLSDEFDRKIKCRLQSFLQHLPLRDRRVMLECVSATTFPAPHKNQVKPTILFLCLNEEQQKAIVNGLKKRSLVPPQFQYRVVIQVIGFCSSVISLPSKPGVLSGQVVVAHILGNGTICGVLGRAATRGSDCTLGGLIRVKGSVYALTTAHGFLGKSPESSSGPLLTGMFLI
jgi:hypothetical protein